MRKGTGATWAACAAAACALLAAAAPASAQENALRRGFDDMGKRIAGQLNDEAGRADGRLRVSFRPARTEPEGVIVYCQALSMGLRDALRESVQYWRKEFDTVAVDARAVAPPDVTMTWLWDGAKSVRVETHVLLAGERSVRYSAKLDAAKLSGSERRCLYTFRRNIRQVEDGEQGPLFTDPSVGARKADYEPGAVLNMLGCLDVADDPDGSWRVVAWTDKATDERVNHLFAPDPDGKCAADTLTIRAAQPGARNWSV